MTKGKRNRIYITMPPECEAQLNALCAAHGVRRGKFVRQLIERALDCAVRKRVPNVDAEYIGDMFEAYAEQQRGQRYRQRRQDYGT